MQKGYKMANSKELNKMPSREIMLCSIGQFVERHGYKALEAAMDELTYEQLWAVFSNIWRYMGKHEERPPGAVKKGMGKRTDNGLFGTKRGTRANRFCKALVQAGKIGLSRYDVRHAKWNPNKYHFNDTMWRLIRECLAKYDDDEQRMYVTNLGLREAKILPEDEW
jgi:hypothetical protein